MIGHRDSVAEIALCILLCRRRHLTQGLCHLIGHNICCNERYREREDCREQEHLEHRSDRLVQRIRILRGDDRAAKLAGGYYRLNAYKMRALVHPAERSRLGISAAVELIQSRPWDGIFAVDYALAHVHHEIGLPYILTADYLAVGVAYIDVRIYRLRELGGRNAHEQSRILVALFKRVAFLNKCRGSLRDGLRVLL